MKFLSLFLSCVIFGVAAYYFAIDLKNSLEMNYLIYMSLLVILMFICIVGILLNLPLIIREKRKLNIFLYTHFSKKKHIQRHERISRLKKHNYSRNTSVEA